MVRRRDARLLSTATRSLIITGLTASCSTDLRFVMLEMIRRGGGMICLASTQIVSLHLDMNAVIRFVLAFLLGSIFFSHGVLYL